MQIVGLSPDDRLVEIVEIPQNDWFVGVQFHPEFKSRLIDVNHYFVILYKPALIIVKKTKIKS